jgi:hypothetical protein
LPEADRDRIPNTGPQVCKVAGFLPRKLCAMPEFGMVRLRAPNSPDNLLSIKEIS